MKCSSAPFGSSVPLERHLRVVRVWLAVHEVWETSKVDRTLLKSRSTPLNGTKRRGGRSHDDHERPTGPKEAVIRMVLTGARSPKW